MISEFPSPSSSITPNQWAAFSNDNIVKTEKECSDSTTLRDIVRGVLEKTAQDVERQRSIVNGAFAKKIEETILAKQLLEDHLEKV